MQQIHVIAQENQLQQKSCIREQANGTSQGIILPVDEQENCDRVVQNHVNARDSMHLNWNNSIKNKYKVLVRNNKLSWHRKQKLIKIPSRASLRDVKKFQKNIQTKVKEDMAYFSSIGRHVYSFLSNQQRFGCLLILIGILSECGAPAPRYNVPIGIFYVSISTVDSNYHLLMVGLLATTIMDYIWLLRTQEPIFNGYLLVEIERFTHCCIAIAAILKVCLIFSIYFVLDQNIMDEQKIDGVCGEDGSPHKYFDGKISSPARDPISETPQHKTKPISRITGTIQYVLPRKTIPSKSRISYEVVMRVLGITWIQGILCVSHLVLGVTTLLLSPSTIQFRSSPLGFSLPVALLIQAAAMFFTFLNTTSAMNLHSCLTLAGFPRVTNCLGGDFDDVVVRYSKSWLKRVAWAKVGETFIGLYLVLVLYAAFHSGTFFAGSMVLVLLISTAIIVYISLIWVPLLILVAARCGARLYELHVDKGNGVDAYHPHQIEWEHASDSTSSKDNESNDESDELANSSDEMENVSWDKDKNSPASTDEHKRSSLNLKLPDRNNGSMHSRSKTIPVVDVDEFIMTSRSHLSSSQDMDSLNSFSKGVWVRHQDESQNNRPYLVHSITNERVWEVGWVAPLQKEEESINGNDYIDNLSTSRNTGRNTNSLDESPLKKNLVTLSNHMDTLWPSTPYAGGFTCLITKIPNSMEIEEHLTRNNFIVVFNGPMQSSIHLVKFMKPLNNKEHDYFLGEFKFHTNDSKLTATFHCPKNYQHIIANIVETLQLNDLIGEFEPCEDP